ncbi:hypothetical protein KXW38_001584, partial [Aspergillus fumigatus]
MSRNDEGGNGESAFHERLFDHEVTGLVVRAFGKTARLEQPLEIFQHRRAAAHHDAVGLDIQRALMQIGEEL